MAQIYSFNSSICASIHVQKLNSMLPFSPYSWERTVLSVMLLYSRTQTCCLAYAIEPQYTLFFLKCFLICTGNSLNKLLIFSSDDGAVSFSKKFNGIGPRPVIMAVMMTGMLTPNMENATACFFFSSGPPSTSALQISPDLSKGRKGKRSLVIW